MQSSELEFMRLLRADAVRQLEMVETVTSILPDDILHVTIERRVGLRKLIKEYDAALAAEEFPKKD